MWGKISMWCVFIGTRSCTVMPPRREGFNLVGSVSVLLSSAKLLPRCAAWSPESSCSFLTLHGCHGDLKLWHAWALFCAGYAISKPILRVSICKSVATSCKKKDCITRTVTTHGQIFCSERNMLKLIAKEDCISTCIVDIIKSHIIASG